MWYRTKCFLSKFTGRFINLEFTSAWEKFDEKKYLWKNFLPSSRMERKLVCFLSKLFRRGCGNDNVFSEQKLFWNHQRFFHNFETLINFFPVFWHFISAGLSKLHFTCPWKTFDEKNLENLNFFTTLSFWTKILRVFSEFSLPDLSKLHSTCPSETWMKTFFAQNIYILLYWDIERIFLPLGWKSSSGVLETAFFVSKTTFWGKLFFLKENLLLSSFLLNEQKLFDNLTFFVKVVKTLYWLPVRKIWGDFFPENISFPIIFGNWVKPNWLLLISLARFSAGSSKFHTTC